MDNTLYEKILNILWKTSQNKVVQSFWRALYSASFLGAKILCLRYAGAKQLYLKGSYARGDYAPLLSDIDLLLVFEKASGETLAKVKRKTGLIKKLFPLVKDIDCYTEAELKERIQYGSLKYQEAEKWVLLTSQAKDIRRTRRFSYPLKEDFDRCQEIFFYVEWIYINLKNSNPTDYRIACAKRACRRICSVAGLVDLNILDELNATTNKREISLWLKKVLDVVPSNSAAYQNFVEKLDVDYEEVLERDYFKSKFSVSDIGIDADLLDEKVLLSKDGFKYFFAMGALDSSVIYEKISLGADPVLNALLLVTYYQSVQDGRHNYLHDNTKDLDLATRYRKAKEELRRCSTFNSCASFLGKTVFVTASWGNDYLKTLGKTHKALKEMYGERIEFLHISLGGSESFFASLKSLMTFRIDWSSSYAGLWHKESLFNIAKRVALGAENIIFADIDVLIIENDWLDKTLNKLKTVEALQPYKSYRELDSEKTTLSSMAALELGADTYYAPGLLWALNKKGLEKLGEFFDFFQDGSNDGVLFKNTTKAKLGLIEELQWTSAEIIHRLNKEHFSFGFIDSEVSHISHPEPKQYNNMITMLNLLHSSVIEGIEKDTLGVWSWKNDCPQQLREILKAFVKTRGFFTEKFFKLLLLKKDQILSFKGQESEFYQDTEKEIGVVTEENNLAFFVESDLGDIGIRGISGGDELACTVSQALPPMKVNTTYCFNFIFRAWEKIEDLTARILNCDSDDIVYTIKPYTNNLYSLQIVFFAFKDFKQPSLELKVKGGALLSFDFKDTLTGSCSEEAEVDWDYLCEEKGSSLIDDKGLRLELDCDFSTNWHKVVAKLDAEAGKYEVRLFGEAGEVMCSPRIQEHPGDYLTIFFRPVTFAKKVVLEIKAENQVSSNFEAVCFTTSP